MVVVLRNKMYRTIENMLKRRKKVQDKHATSTGRGYDSYHCSLSRFLEELVKSERNKDSVIFRETTGWKPKAIFSWDKPQFFSPQKAANYVKERHLLDDPFLYFESRWQIYSGRGEEQHYFDIDIYHTTYCMGSKEIGRLKKKITLDYLMK